MKDQSVTSFAPRKLTKNGQTSIPKAVRDLLGVKSGDYVSFNVINGTVVVTKELVSTESSEATTTEAVP